MTSPARRRVAVIGAGISGIAAANVLKKSGFEPVVFEKAASVGGVWAVAYPSVRLQNIGPHYHLSDFPWPFRPDLHPTGAQILRYLRAAVEHFHIDVRLEHEVVALEERDGGWLVRHRNANGFGEEVFEFVIVSVGQYTEGKNRPEFPGQAEFHGDVITERDVTSLDVFDGKRVVVIGFGKSAVDMASMAAKRAASVHQVFRTPRWLLPEHILGVHFTYALFNRFGTVMMTSWAHPTAAERFLHTQLRGVVSSFWGLIESVFRFQIRRHAPRANAGAQHRLRVVQPTHKLLPDLRSAAAIAPERYYGSVADGRIEPRRAELSYFTRGGVVLNTSEPIDCDLVVLSVGSETPVFPFLPDNYRCLLEREPDGPQLYRHLIHPRIPRLGFAGFNHGFMHVPAAEIGTLWVCALLRGELELPSVEAMEYSIECVREWKRANIHFEPSRGCAVNTRFQQYLDVLLLDLGVSPYRKLPNVPAEIFARYEARDYRGVFDEYSRTVARRTESLRPLPLHT